MHDISSLTRTEETKGITGCVIVSYTYVCQSALPQPTPPTYKRTQAATPSIIHLCDLFFICVFLFQNGTVLAWVPAYSPRGLRNNKHVSYETLLDLNY